MDTQKDRLSAGETEMGGLPSVVSVPTAQIKEGDLSSMGCQYGRAVRNDLTAPNVQVAPSPLKAKPAFVIARPPPDEAAINRHMWS